MQEGRVYFEVQRGGNDAEDLNAENVAGSDVEFQDAIIDAVEEHFRTHAPAGLHNFDISLNNVRLFINFVGINMPAFDNIPELETVIDGTTYYITFDPPEMWEMNNNENENNQQPAPAVANEPVGGAGSVHEANARRGGARSRRRSTRRRNTRRRNTRRRNTRRRNTRRRNTRRRNTRN